MDHFKPHKRATFEGYYTRFLLSDGGSLIVIMCTVHRKIERPHNVTITYVPPDNRPIWQSEVWPATYSCKSQEDGMTFKASGAWDSGSESCEIDGVLHEDGGNIVIKVSDGFMFGAVIESHEPWSETSTSPEGIFIHLPLPLHWHVLSTLSPAEISLKLPSSAGAVPNSLLAESDEGEKIRLRGVAHLEKNWAISFPAAHTWIQGHREDLQLKHSPPASKSSMASTTHTLTLAGGPIMGIEAYLVGYRNPTASPPISVDFRPPFTMDFRPLLEFIPLPRRFVFLLQSLFRPLLSPFISTARDWSKRTMRFSFSDLWHSLEIEVGAPSDTFYNLSGPYPAGFKEKWMAQSLRGKAWLKYSKRESQFPWRWKTVCEDWFENVGIEFGGEYYPRRGVGEAADSKNG